jgi:protein arginine kinase activator
MQCDICSKKKATVHLTEIVDEQMSEMHLCEECARNKSAQMEQQFGLGDLLAGLSADVGKGPLKSDDKASIKCAGCGLNYEDFRKFGRLGCGQCYVSFKEHLSGLLRKIHGSNRHLGKTPFGVKPEAAVEKAEPVSLPHPAPEPAALLVSENIDDLKKQLHDAIAAEDFEKAAKLRDKIRKMEHS